MPGRYRYKRSYKSRRSYKKKTSFSKYNTFRYRSSKAQANQIYRLNRKINYVYKMSKPETQIYQSDVSPIYNEVVADTLRGRSFALHRCIDQSLGVFRGKTARIKNVVFTGSFNFVGNPAETEQEAVGCLRLIFFRLRTEKWNFPSILDVLPSDITNYSNEYFMKCPLAQGFSKFKLVGDYKFYLQPKISSNKFINIKIKYPYLLRRGDNLQGGEANLSYPKNSLFCVSYISRVGQSSSIDCFDTELFMKVAFTDDSYNMPDNRTIQPSDTKQEEKICPDDVKTTDNDSDNDCSV